MEIQNEGVTATPSNQVQDVIKTPEITETQPVINNGDAQNPQQSPVVDNQIGDISNTEVNPVNNNPDNSEVIAELEALRLENINLKEQVAGLQKRVDDNVNWSKTVKNSTDIAGNSITNLTNGINQYATSMQMLYNKAEAETLTSDDIKTELDKAARVYQSTVSDGANSLISQGMALYNIPMEKRDEFIRHIGRLAPDDAALVRLGLPFASREAELFAKDLNESKPSETAPQKQQEDPKLKQALESNVLLRNSLKEMQDKIEQLTKTVTKPADTTLVTPPNGGVVSSGNASTPNTEVKGFQSSFNYNPDDPDSRL